MSSIEIFDTEVFTGCLDGPLVHLYELEFTKLGSFDEHPSIKKSFVLSGVSTFVVPLPSEIRYFDGSVLVSLNEKKTRRNIFSAEIRLGTVFYHNFGTIPCSAQPTLSNEIPFALPTDQNLAPRSWICWIFIALVVGLIYKFKSLCGHRHTIATHKNNHHTHRGKSTLHESTLLVRNGSMSTLTNTDHESADGHSLAPRRAGEYVLAQKATKKHHHGRKHKFTPYGAMSNVHCDDWDPFSITD